MTAEKLALPFSDEKWSSQNSGVVLPAGITNEYGPLWGKSIEKAYEEGGEGEGYKSWRDGD